MDRHLSIFEKMGAFRDNAKIGQGSATGGEMSSEADN